MSLAKDMGLLFSAYPSKSKSFRIKLATFLVSMWSIFQAKGTIFLVTNSLDNGNGLTLRKAIIKANSAGGSNTIILTNSNYQLTIVGTHENFANKGDLDITKGKLIIIGKSPTNVTINAIDLGDRVFHVLQGAQLTLSNLVITGGKAPNGTSGSSGGGGKSGGGIYNAGTLILYGSIVKGNTSGAGGFASSSFGNGGNGGNGGGIYNGGTLVLHHSMVNGNFTGPGGDGGALQGNGGSNSQGGNGGNGGAVYNVGTATINDSTITDNTNGLGGTFRGSGGSGGGIYNEGTLLMTNTLVGNNFCGSYGNINSAGSTGGNGGSGGGIYSIGSSTLFSCLISNNSAGSGSGIVQGFYFGEVGGSGGGIFNGGTLSLYYCTLIKNSSGEGAEGGSIAGNAIIGFSGANGGDGGGIYNTNLILLKYTTISGNHAGGGGLGGQGTSAGSGGNGGNGGGIYNNGNITLTLCTVSGNLSGNGGRGGIGLFDSSNNGAGGNGGGIFNDGSTSLTSCTVSYNFTGMGDYLSPSANGTNGGSGGGIFNQTTNQLVKLSDSLIALNGVGAGGLGNINDYSGIGLDLFGNFISQGYNLIGQIEGSFGVTNEINNDLAGNKNAPINPLLGPLQDNGGPAFTHALLLGSPAIDQGNDFNLKTDQRGNSRPHDYYSITNASGGDSSDIGAFEADVPILNIQKLSDTILLSWDTNCPNYVLEFTSDISSSNSWILVPGTRSVSDRQFQITNNFTTDNKLFRLQSN